VPETPIESAAPLSSSPMTGIDGGWARSERPHRSAGRLSDQE